jgi:hypothetical protein
LHERATELAEHCRRLAARAPAGSDLSSVGGSLERLSAALEPHALAGKRAIESA